MLSNNKPTKLSHAKSARAETLAEIDVDAIINNPQQPRFLNLEDKDLKDLASSIEQQGLIQPITVITKDDKYILQAGQRRWLAHKLLGRKTIQAIVHQGSTFGKNKNEKDLFEVAIIENIQRKNLVPLELSMSMQQALDKKLYKNKEELSAALGKSSSYIGKVLKILALDNTILTDLKMNKSINDVESLYELQKIKDPRKQISTYFDFLHKKIDRNGIRELTKSKKDVSNKKGLYKFTGRAKVLKLELDTTSLTDKKIQEMKHELEEVLKKYIPE